MLVLEFTSESSEEIFWGLPFERHSAFLSMCEKALTSSSSSHQFIKINIISLIKNQFVNTGFLEFDHEELFDRFNSFFRQNYKRCCQCLKSGYMEDFNDLVDEFFAKTH